MRKKQLQKKYVELVAASRAVVVASGRARHIAEVSTDDGGAAVAETILSWSAALDALEDLVM